MAETLDFLVQNFEVQANSDYQKTWALVDDATGDSLLVDTSVIRMELKPVGSSAATVASLVLEVEAGTSVSGFKLDADVETNGEFIVTIIHDDLQDLIGTESVVTFAYDFLQIFTDGVRTIYARGTWTIRRGVTYG